jgi:hypothetical protein
MLTEMIDVALDATFFAIQPFQISHLRHAPKTGRSKAGRSRGDARLVAAWIEACQKRDALQAELMNQPVAASMKRRRGPYGRPKPLGTNATIFLWSYAHTAEDRAIPEWMHWPSWLCVTAVLGVSLDWLLLDLSSC